MTRPWAALVGIDLRLAALEQPHCCPKSSAPRSGPSLVDSPKGGR